MIERTTKEDAMGINAKEHYDVMGMFEKEYKGRRLDREKDKALWAKGYVYADGMTNELFLAYRKGYAFAQAVA